MSYTSYRTAHPIGWMHALPSGEIPGWKTDLWFQSEIAQANIWNAPLELYNESTGDTYNYTADYEQTSLILEAGYALNERVALALELPYAYRGPGFLDEFIDSFHVLIGSTRFQRPLYPRNAHKFSIQYNSTETVTQHSKLSELNHIKLKLKYWLWKKTNKNCPCGLSLSTHGKFTIKNDKAGGTSGNNDYTAMINFGLPIFDNSAFWFSAASIKLGENQFLKEWPLRRWQQMYEIGVDISISEKWSISLQWRTESPILEKDKVSYVDTTSDPTDSFRKRVASGLNSLIYWRGSQGLGVSYKPNENSQWNYMLIEDWNVGKYDDPSLNIYVNNAPDVSFLMQYSFGL